MMNNTLRNQCNVLPGTIITGKWNKNDYKIIKELGCGANGIVYLAENNRQYVALKLSDNGVSIMSEMNILKAFSKVQGSILGPSFMEADDYVKNGKMMPFYVMEYIKGESYLPFIQNNGQAWIGVLMLQLLSSLSILHKQGWVFGDLKPENLIVTLPAYKIRCIDVGGTTLVGRSVKEFTEFFDRGYWGMGSRRADPEYDLFAVAMIMINSSYPTRFSKNGEGYTQLKDLVRQKKELTPYKAIIEKALLGKYSSADEMRHDLIGILNRQSTKKQAPKSTPSGNLSATSQTRKTRSNNKKSLKKRKGSMIETVVLVTIVSMLYMLYIYGQLL
ncbi:serine/threonine-protein kinase [Bacillus sp. V59.32b]|uniref:protein kinase domain-containing protein n=1 Tax=Bacillus sp. V59.32b TaxID=1758642 RepID=UPI000E3D71C0|nr:serine/threonine-protein kinase [Bacillus sp. V59.32b]RFU60360.1 protein kinase family protein [Bacillus sp. V59.32b]